MKSRLALVLLCIFFQEHTNAQSSKEAKVHLEDRILSLRLENTKTHSNVLIEVNQKVAYKLHSSRGFIKDKIISITDSTISFYNSYKLLVTSTSGATKVIVPGMDVKVILKSGERIARMNVLRIGAEKIEGIRISGESGKVWKGILIKEVVSIEEWDSTQNSGVTTIVVEDISFMLKDLGAIKIQSSKGSRAFGSVLMVIGGLGTFIGVVSALNPPSGSDPSGVGTGMHQAGLIIGAAGVPLVAGGIALKGDRKIVLGGSWSFKVKKASRKD